MVGKTDFFQSQTSASSLEMPLSISELLLQGGHKRKEISSSVLQRNNRDEAPEDKNLTQKRDFRDCAYGFEINN